MATLEQLENALRKAHAAGNADHARAFAAEIRRMRESPATKADFSNVQGGVSSTEASTQPPAQQSQEPSFLDAVKRQAGIGGRAMLRGVYDLSGMLGGDLIGAAEAKLTGQPARTSRESADWLADRIGLPRPETATERVSSDISSAVTGGGGLVGAGRLLATQTPRAVAGIGRLLSTQPATQIASAATGAGAASATREAGGGTGAQLAAGLAGGMAPSFGVAGVSEALRRTVRGGEAGRATMERNIADFRRVGATPSVGQAAANGRTRGLESLLAGAPTSAARMGQFAEKQADDIGSGLRGMADDFMPNASGERAGRAVERGAETFSNNVKAMKRALYWQVDQRIPDTTPMPMAATQRALVDLTTPNPAAAQTTGSLINPKIAQLRQNVMDDMAANGGVLPYSAAKELRSRIGEELTDYTLSVDRPTREYKALYAALSRDLEEAAKSQGPEAVAAARRANNYTRAAAERLEQIQRVVDKNGGPEKVYNAVVSGTQDGGTTLRAVMQSLPKDGQRAVTAAIIKRMGLATPGQQNAAGDAFSAQTFLTKWAGLSDEAKRAAFHRHGPRFVANMDKVSRVAQNIRDGSRVFANPSGTANRAAAYGYYTGLAGTAAAGMMGAGPVPLVSLVLGGLSANAAARAMTNPRVVGWLARATEMPVSSLPQQVMLLKSQAQASGDDDLAELAAALEQQGNGQGDN